MRLLINIGHPAHVHFFNYFIHQAEKDGHQVMVGCWHRGIVPNLLDAYHIEYCLVGKRIHGLPGMVFSQIRYEYNLYRLAKKFNPDILLGIGGTANSHVGKLIRKPSIVFTDTEHARLSNLITFPFADVICTPSCFKKDLGEKQVRYNGYHELAYLHPNYFKPDPSVLSELGLSENDRFIIVRFVSWGASHDARQHGFTNPKDIVSRLEPYGRVLITSEVKLDADLEKYRITLHPDKLHDLLYYATLYIGEGATIASECAVLGTPAIYVSTLRLGYLDEQEERYGLVYNFSNPRLAQEQAVAKAIELLQRNNLKEEWQLKREKLLQEKVDVTNFMVELIGNYG